MNSENTVIWKTVRTERRDLQSPAADAFVAAMSENVEAVLTAFFEELAAAQPL